MLCMPGEFVKMNQDILQGKSVQGFHSVNEVREMPQNFTKWMQDNRYRIIRAKSTPYFIKDNYKYGNVDKGLKWEKAKLTPQEIGAQRHAARTQADIDDIQRRWNLSRIESTSASHFDAQYLQEDIQEGVSAEKWNEFLKKPFNRKEFEKMVTWYSREAKKIKKTKKTTKVTKTTKAAETKKTPVVPETKIQDNTAEAKRIYKEALSKGDESIQLSKIFGTKYDEDKGIAIDVIGREHIDWSKGKVMSVSTTGLHSVQNEVFPDILTRYIKTPSADTPQIIRVGKTDYVFDGNHRMAASIINGQKEVKALVLEISESKFNEYLRMAETDEERWWSIMMGEEKFDFGLKAAKQKYSNTFIVDDVKKGVSEIVERISPTHELKESLRKPLETFIKANKKTLKNDEIVLNSQNMGRWGDMGRTIVERGTDYKRSTITISSSDVEVVIHGKKVVFNPLEQLEGAMQAIKEGKELTFIQEYSVENVWHEMMHAGAKGWIDFANAEIPSLVNSMECINQFCARMSYDTLLRGLGGKSKWGKEILEHGVGYSDIVKNFCSTLEKFGISKKEAYDYFKGAIKGVPYEDIRGHIVTFLKKRKAPASLAEKLVDALSCEEKEFLKLMDGV